jgi:hypothetical protein
VGEDALEAEAEAGVRHCTVAARVVVPGVVLAVDAVLDRSSRWLPPMIWPIPGANTSIAATVRPSSFSRM